jgi:hypothetical protein
MWELILALLTLNAVGSLLNSFGNVALFRYLVKWRRTLNDQVQRMLTMDQKMLDLLDAIDKETDAIATEVTDLRSQISGNMTPADVAAVDTRLQAISDRLTGIAADPAAPVPPAPAPTA